MWRFLKSSGAIEASITTNLISQGSSFYLSYKLPENPILTVKDPAYYFNSHKDLVLSVPYVAPVGN